MALGWGIIGLGRAADTLWGPALAADPNSRVVSVVSRDQGRAEAFAAKHGAVSAGTEFGAMLADPRVDVVLITTPNALHPDQAVAAAEAGKHIFCDKPLAPDEAEARRVLEACSRAGVKIATGFQSRFHSCFQEAREVIAGGEIGEVVSAQVDGSSGTRAWVSWRAEPELAVLGAINNVAVHLYDLLRFLVGDEVTEVAALFDTGRRPDLEKLPMVLMRFSKGALAFANGNQATAHPLNDIVVHGSRGRIDGRGITRPMREGEMRVLSESGERTRRYSTHDCYERTIASFTLALSEGREPSPSGLDGLRCVQITDAVARSAREGRTVQIAY
ncbi:MAG: Gfo/Idh/MocA family protein [Candidatus Dormibacterales bacterium]